MSRRVTCGYHCTAKPVSFGRGQSAVHTSAYNARTQLMHEQGGVETRDYSKHRGGALLFEGVFAPEGAPKWARDREQLWNRAEAAERQKVNGQPARNMIVAFPHELDQQQREWLLKDFAREQFARKGMAADVAMHAPDGHGDQRNYHAHILLTMRRFENGDFARTKERDWNRKEQLGDWREAWAEKGAKALARAGYPVEAERWRHGHETLEKQRAAALARGDAEFAESLEREATVHKGTKLTGMERRGVDIASDWLDGAKQIDARNDARSELKAADRELAALEAEQARELAAAWNAAQDRPAEDWRTKQAAAQAAWQAKAPSLSPATEAKHRVKDAARETKAGGLKVMNKASGVLSGLGDFMTNYLASVGYSSRRDPEASGQSVAAFLMDPAERKRQQLARLAQQEADDRDRKAVESMDRDIKAGKALSSADIGNLTRAHQMQIHAFGDDGVMQIIDDLRRRESDRGRERERE